MLHNKHLQIMYQILCDYNKEIYGRELTNLLKISQKNIALTLKELESQNILKSKQKGNLKLYNLNTQNALIKDIIKIAELSKKVEFLTLYKVLKYLFIKNDKRIVGIFGSYARNKQKNDSDLDLFIIGNKVKEDYDKLGKEFDFPISIKYFTESQFQELCKEKNNLIKEIIINHILIHNIDLFIELIWRDYYGYN